MAILLAGNPCKAVELMVPRVGTWLAEVDLESAIELPEGAVTLTIGAVTLTGAILPEASGRFLVKTKARVVGGAGGWRKELPARAYHNDAGVSVASVLASTASACGETFELPLPPDRLAADYVRIAGAARLALQRLAPAWWVGFDGITRTSARTTSTSAPTALLQDFDPRSASAVFQVADVTDLAVGATVTDRLDQARTVQALNFTFRDKAQAVAWLL